MVANKYKIAVTTVKGKAFLTKTFTPFEKSFLSNSLDKDIMCLIEWRKQKYIVKAIIGEKIKFKIIIDNKSKSMTSKSSNLFLYAKYK